MITLLSVTVITNSFICSATKQQILYFDEMPLFTNFETKIIIFGFLIKDIWAYILNIFGVFINLRMEKVQRKINTQARKGFLS